MLLVRRSSFQSLWSQQAEASGRYEGNVSAIEFLVQNGADVNQRNTEDGSNLLYISAENNHLPVVKFLIKHGANVNQTCKDGTSPLYISSQNGFLPIVEYLVQNGAKVNQFSMKMC